MTLPPILDSLFLYEVNAAFLSSAALLSAIVSALHSAWYAEISGALLKEKEPEREDRETAIKELKEAQSSRSLPLCWAAVLLSASMFFPATSTVVIGARALCKEWRYDPIATCFFAMYVIALILTWRILSRHRFLRAKVKDFEES